MRFPLDLVPKLSWHNRPRSFGAPRPNGRKHAGCDLYADIGTPVYAVADGVVIGATAFYKGTWAVAVDHGTFTIRYGEVDKRLPPGIKAKAKVSEGDLIGTIGDLEGIAASMLHFEMYSGAASGPLTNAANKPYMRRSDLLDPTDFLDGLITPRADVALRLGATGDDVVAWQQRLVSLGYALAIDGIFGTETDKATKLLQVVMGVPPTGSVDEPTHIAGLDADKP